MTIYHLNKVAGALIRQLYPDGKLIRANPAKDTLESVLAAVPKNDTEFIYHFDITYTDVWPTFRKQLTAALRAREIQVCNTHAVDLSRKTLQAALAAAGLPTLTAKRNGSPSELLLVRPNFNYSGFAEAKFNARYPALFPRYPKTVTTFQIMPRCDVAANLWDDPDVQIEKFVSNPENKIYRVWMWKGRNVAAKFINPDPIKKGDGVVAHWRCIGTTKDSEMRPVIQYGRKVFKQMRYDYGACDVLVDGKGALYACDMNSTPWFGPFWRNYLQVSTETLHNPVRYLREGIDE